MDYIYARKLTKKQLNDIQKLEKKYNYGILLDNDEAEIPLYYLAYEGNILVGILILIESLDGYEVNALIDAQHRRQGHFTALLALAKAHSQGETLFITYSPDDAPFDFRQTSFCGELIYQDLFMTLGKKGFMPVATTDASLYIEYIDNCYYLKKATKGRPCLIGHLFLDYESDFTNVWGVEIRSKYRNCGYGFILMNCAIVDYFSNHDNQLLLHVQSYNTPAVKLYKKLGFKLHATISNYYV